MECLPVAKPVAVLETIELLYRAAVEPALWPMPCSGLRLPAEAWAPPSDTEAGSGRYYSVFKKVVVRLEGRRDGFIARCNNPEPSRLLFLSRRTEGDLFFCKRNTVAVKYASGAI
jgi:hypothetical protein